VKAAQHELVMHLALDWLHATGNAPKSRRSDSCGFGDLVYCVFQWLDISEDSSETAAYALRRYWDTGKTKKKRAAPFAMPLVCSDCRWVRSGVSRDEFVCEKLSRACTAARGAEGDCGPEGLLFERG
jgi:hypothetical protein